MALLSTQEVAQAGSVVTLVAAAGGGDSFVPGEGVHLRVKNASGGSITATVASIVPCNQGAHHDIAVTVAAGTEEVAGPFPASRFADANGHAAISYSSATSVTVGAVHLPS